MWISLYPARSLALVRCGSCGHRSEGASLQPPPASPEPSHLLESRSDGASGKRSVLEAVWRPSREPEWSRARALCCCVNPKGEERDPPAPQFGHCQHRPGPPTSSAETPVSAWHRRWGRGHRRETPVTAWAAAPGLPSRSLFRRFPRRRRRRPVPPAPAGEGAPPARLRVALWALGVLGCAPRRCAVGVCRVGVQRGHLRVVANIRRRGHGRSRGRGRGSPRHGGGGCELVLEGGEGAQLPPEHLLSGRTGRQFLRDPRYWVGGVTSAARYWEDPAGGDPLRCPCYCEGGDYLRRSSSLGGTGHATTCRGRWGCSYWEHWSRV